MLFILIFSVACIPIFSEASAADVDLTALNFSCGTLSSAFDKDTTLYTIYTGSASCIIVTPFAANANASVRINGTACKSGSSCKITLSLNVPKITIIVSSTDGYSKCYIINILMKSPPNAGLSSLCVSSGTLSPYFSTDTTKYALTVDGGTESVTLTPTAIDSTQTIEVNGQTVADGSNFVMNLSLGTNTVSILVTSMTGTIKIYTVTITRPVSSNADLSALSLSSGTLSPAFSKDTLEYTASVDNSITQINITATVSDSTAALKINGTNSQNVPLAVGSNTVTVSVTAADGTTKTYTVTVTRRASSNADLSNLSLSSGSLFPAFSKDTTKYSASVDNSVTQINITATAADPTAAVLIANSTQGCVSLFVGSNTVAVSVTAADGTAKTYTVTVTRRASSNADLSNLSLSSGSLSPAFSKDTLEYSASVDNSVSKLYITATAQDTEATVKINGSTRQYVTLNVGSNTVAVLVTAADGTAKTYTVTVTRPPSSNADLSDLSLSSGTLSPAFFKDTLEYSASVDNSIAQISITAALSDSTATLKINGTDSQYVPLDIGSNTVTVTITAADGTTKTYTVTVTRRPSSNADLSDLSLSSGTLSPAFSNDTAKYSASVDNSVTQINITATASDPTAEVLIADSTEGCVPLNVGSNTVTVTVTAADGTAKTFTITVIRFASSNAYLSSLVLSSGSLSPAFSKDTFEYSASVGNSVSKLYISAAASYSAATIKVDGSEKQYALLNVGSNTVTVTVTAADGTTAKTYTITVFRKYGSEISATTQGPGGAYIATVPDYVSLFGNSDAITFDLGSTTIIIPAGTLQSCKGNGNLAVSSRVTPQDTLKSAASVSSDSCVIAGGVDISMLKNNADYSCPLNSRTTINLSSVTKTLLKKGSPAIYYYDSVTKSLVNMNAVFDFSAGTAEFAAAKTGTYIIAVALSDEYINYSVSADSTYSGTGDSRSFNVKIERGADSPRISDEKIMVVTTLSTGAQVLYFKDITEDSCEINIGVSKTAVQSAVYLISGSFSGNNIPESYTLVQFVNS